MAFSIFSLIDLTSLGDDDTPESISTVCQKATGPFGSVAAVCVYPKFVQQARDSLPDNIQIATVVNFPSGNEVFDDVWAQTAEALDNGADEIDLVIPYQNYLAGHRDPTILLVQNTKALCGNKKLKVILESGAFSDDQLLFQAAEDVLFAGADFVKTSTGKISVGATPEAVAVLCRALKSFENATGEKRGLKISGGVRTQEQAAAYLKLVCDSLGEDFIRPKTLRFGASSLVDAL